MQDKKKKKQHIVASGHNSPGKPSTISQDRKQCLCMEKEEQMYLPNLPAISFVRLSLYAWLSKLQANIPEKLSSPYRIYLPLPLPIKCTSSSFSLTPHVCFFPHCLTSLSLHNPEAPLAVPWHQCLLVILPYFQLLVLLSKGDIFSFRMLQ